MNRSNDSHSVARHAFTLIELLVVVAIIVVLLTLLAAAIGRALEAAERAACGAHENGIYKAARSFSTSNQNRVHKYRSSNFKWFTNEFGTAEEAADFAGQQHNSETGRTQISSDDGRAYWGVLYTETWGAHRKMFNCPAAVRCDLNKLGEGEDDFGDAPKGSSDEVAWELGGQWTNYGFNGTRGLYFGSKQRNAPPTGTDADPAAEIARDSADGSYWDDEDTDGRERGRKWSQIKSPGKTIFFHDAMETMLEGGSDTIFNIREWHFLNEGGNPDDAQGYLEWFRHTNGTNIIWADGSVEYVQSPKNLEETYLPFGDGPEYFEVRRWYRGN